ncbi:MAG: GNAT family N-acetyltransferase [Patescibacteria group bacterium]
MNPTKRLTFHPLTPEWAGLIFEHNTGNVKDYFYNFKSEEDARVWVAQAIAAAKDTDKEEFVILANGEFVGMISSRTNSDSTGDIGMWIAESQQRKGYGREALKAAIDYLKAKGVLKIVYEIEKGNVASMALSTSLGMKPASSDDKYHQFILDLVSPQWPG